MEELDLHGISHEQVWDIVENFVLLNSEKLPLRIVTGLSEKMRKHVTDVLDFYEFDYEIPIYNNGQINVLQDKEFLWPRNQKK